MWTLHISATLFVFSIVCLKLCVAAAGNVARIYSATDGKELKHSYSKKYGCDLVRFTHRNTNLLHSSTLLDHTLRLLSTHDNKYIRYFKGHSATVMNLEMCPTDDTFLSSSTDGQVYKWDLRVSDPVAHMQVPRNLAPTEMRPLVSWDPSGLVFAVGCNSRYLRLYDARNFQSVCL